MLLFIVLLLLFCIVIIRIIAFAGLDNIVGSKELKNYIIPDYFIYDIVVTVRTVVCLVLLLLISLFVYLFVACGTLIFLTENKISIVLYVGIIF